jgi:hypothetical protein
LLLTLFSVLFLKKKKGKIRVPNGKIHSKGKQGCIERRGGSMATP